MHALDIQSTLAHKHTQHTRTLRPQDFLINVLLTLLGYIPGIIHALYIILRY